MGRGGSRRMDLSGEKFGKFTVIGFSHTTHPTFSYWNCQCDCGVQEKVSIYRLRRKTRRSLMCQNCQPVSRHETRSDGKRYSIKEYRAWTQAKARCYRKTHFAYIDYGARGIKMTKRWRESFDAFLEDMGKCPVGKVLGRKNNDGDFSAKNCKWMTYKEVRANRRPVGEFVTRRTAV